MYIGLNVQPDPVLFVQLAGKYWAESGDAWSTIGYNVPPGCQLVAVIDTNERYLIINLFPCLCLSIGHLLLFLQITGINFPDIDRCQRLDISRKKKLITELTPLS